MAIDSARASARRSTFHFLRSPSLNVKLRFSNAISFDGFNLIFSMNFMSWSSILLNQRLFIFTKWQRLAMVLLMAQGWQGREDRECRYGPRTQVHFVFSKFNFKRREKFAIKFCRFIFQFWTRYRTDPIKVLWVNIELQPQILDSFGLEESEEPDHFVAYRPKRNKLETN